MWACLIFHTAIKQKSLALHKMFLWLWRLCIPSIPRPQNTDSSHTVHKHRSLPYHKQKRYPKDALLWKIFLRYCITYIVFLVRPTLSHKNRGLVSFVTVKQKADRVHEILMAFIKYGFPPYWKTEIKFMSSSLYESIPYLWWILYSFFLITTNTRL